MATDPQPLKLSVATPLGLALETEASAVQAPSVEGEFGVLSGHLPLLGALKAGVLTYRREGKDYWAAVGAGFVEAEPDRLLILTEQFAPSSAIDIEATRKELQTAEEALKRASDEVAAKELALRVDWAHACLRAAAAAAA